MKQDHVCTEVPTLCIIIIPGRLYRYSLLPRYEHGDNIPCLPVPTHAMTVQYIPGVHQAPYHPPQAYPIGLPYRPTLSTLPTHVSPLQRLQRLQASKSHHLQPCAHHPTNPPPNLFRESTA